MYYGYETSEESGCHTEQSAFWSRDSRFFSALEVQVAPGGWSTDPSIVIVLSPLRRVLQIVASTPENEESGCYDPVGCFSTFNMDATNRVGPVHDWAPSPIRPLQGPPRRFHFTVNSRGSWEVEFYESAVEASSEFDPGPLSLMNLCRRVIRRNIPCTHLEEHVNELALPTLLQNFLMYKDRE